MSQPSWVGINRSELDIKMSKKYLIFTMFHVLPKRYFDRIRRRHSLCKYNFHSPVQIRAFPKSKKSPIADMVCVHCGINIDRDDRGQWKRDVRPTFLNEHLHDEYRDLVHIEKYNYVQQRELCDDEPLI